MATNEIICFRPKIDFLDDFEKIQEWCENNQSTFSSVVNSFLPAIAYAVRNDIITVDGKRYIKADFGDVLLCEPNYLRARRYTNEPETEKRSAPPRVRTKP